MAEIVPAILTNDLSDFRKEYAELFAFHQYFTKLHVDFADGQFVNNQTLMPKDLQFLKSSPLTLIGHFMTLNPKQYFQDAKAAGFSWVLFHIETFTQEKEIEETILAAQDLNLKPGLVLNPETPMHKLGKFVSQIPLIQLMGIHPGFQGREFMLGTYDRIRELRSLSKSVIISIDGGVRVGIASNCAKLGADQLVAGSAILKAADEQTALTHLIQDINIKN